MTLLFQLVSQLVFKILLSWDVPCFLPFLTGFALSLFSTLKPEPTLDLYPSPGKALRRLPTALKMKPKPYNVSLTPTPPSVEPTSPAALSSNTAAPWPRPRAFARAPAGLGPPPVKTSASPCLVTSGTGEALQQIQRGSQPGEPGPSPSLQAACLPLGRPAAERGPGSPGHLCLLKSQDTTSPQQPRFR